MSATEQAEQKKSKGRNTDRTCFVIGPIGARDSENRKHADKLLRIIIRPTFNTHFKNFKVLRADEIARPGMIDSQVITHLIEADLVLADLTTWNANAFYELGIRHMVQKPVIHLYRHGEKIPADIAPYRALDFSYDAVFDIRDAKVALRKMVTEVLDPAFVTENPVTRSRGFMRLQSVKAHRAPVKSVQKPKIARTKSNAGVSEKPRDERPRHAPPRYKAPGVQWDKVRDGWRARWHAEPVAVRKGYLPRNARLWTGPDQELKGLVIDFITSRAQLLDDEMFQWMESRGMHGERSS